jgi:ribonuclease HI
VNESETNRVKQPAQAGSTECPICYITVDGSMTEALPNTMLVYFDGGCAPNPGKMSACVVICPPVGKPDIHTMTDLGQGTNNVAEWSALILAATLLKDTPGKITIMGDSQLVINQANGLWRLKDDYLRILASEYFKIAKRLDLELKYVPRERNLAGRYLEHGFL